MTAAITALDLALGAGVLTTATLAAFTRDRTVSVMMFLSMGMLLAVLWARLDAPDLAIAEAAIAAGVTGALLISTLGTLGPAADAPARSTLIRLSHLLAHIAVITVAAGLLTLGLIEASTNAVLPAAAGSGATDAVQDSVVEHPITAVLLQFRSYDTLLEVVVLAAVALVAFSLPRDRAVRSHHVRQEQGDLFAGFTRVALPVVVLLAGWLLIAGSTRPGGAFQAGALVTGALLLLYLSGRHGVGGRFAADPPRRLLLTGVLIGPAAFIGLAVLTATAGQGWLHLAHPWGGGVVVAVEAALALSIGVSLAAAFLVGRRDVPLLAEAPGAGLTNPGGERR